MLVSTLLSIALSVRLDRRTVVSLTCAVAATPGRLLAVQPAPSQKVLVAGASGRTGRLVVEQLLGEDIEPVAGLRSSMSKGAKSLPASVARITGLDLADDEATTITCLSTEMSRLGITDVVCTIGFAPTMVGDVDRAGMQQVDYRATAKLIAAAEQAKLPGRFVLVSSLGVNVRETSSSARLLDASLGNVLVQKLAAEQALRKSVLDWCIVRPGLLLKEKVQGGILLGGEDRWTGESAERDRRGLGEPVSCASPFLASSGAVCAATRGQVAAVCVEALRGDKRLFSRKVVEVVARPEIPLQQFDSSPDGRRTRQFRLAGG